MMLAAAATDAAEAARHEKAAEAAARAADEAAAAGARERAGTERAVREAAQRQCACIMKRARAQSVADMDATSPSLKKARIISSQPRFQKISVQRRGAPFRIIHEIEHGNFVRLSPPSRPRRPGAK